MDSQLEAVRHKIPKVEDKIEKIEQDLAAAKEAKNGEQERKLFDMLLSLNNQLSGLNNQLSGLQEEKNILLRSQAPSKPCFWLVHTGLPVFTSFCAPFVCELGVKCCGCVVTFAALCALLQVTSLVGQCSQISRAG